MTDFFLIATCLIISQYTDENAGKQFATQIYQQRGIEKNITEYIDKNVNESLKVQAGNIVFISKTLYDKKIVWEMKF